MRLLATAIMLAIGGSILSAADKDEDKAKEAALAFLKAVKAKDLDAAMKTADVPFLTEDKDGAKVIDKVDDLKGDLKEKFGKIKDAERIPSELGKVVDVTGVRKLFESRTEPVDKKALEQIEKVLGKSGYAVFLIQDGKERGALLVRIKDGKAKVVGIPN
jgi:hypothetical protein